MKKDITAVSQALLAMQRASWEQGVAAQAFFECGDPQMGILLVKEAIHRGNGAGLIGITTRAMDSIDCGSNGLPAYYAYQHTKEGQYLKAAKDLADWFVFNAPRSASGQLYHNPGTLKNMIDGIYHFVPVLVVTGNIEFAMKQIQLFHERHYDPASGLYRQLWDDGQRSFIRRALWGGGQGWMAGALALACKFLPGGQEAHRAHLAELLLKLINSMEAYLRDDYLFHDVLDDPNTFVEVTAALMLSYAIYVGIQASVIPAEKKYLADKILDSVEGHVDEYGIIHEACSSPTFDRPGCSAEAQAFYMLCYGAKEKLQ